MQVFEVLHPDWPPDHDVIEGILANGEEPRLQAAVE
jgi:hypothetical protein